MLSLKMEKIRLRIVRRKINIGPVGGLGCKKARGGGRPEAKKSSKKEGPDMINDTHAMLVDHES